MRKHVRIGSLFAIAVAALAAPVFSTADTANDQVIGSWEQMTTGGGANNQFIVSAQSEPDGSDPTGMVTIKVKGSDQTGLKAAVTCLRVDVNMATIVARFTKATNQGNREGVILKVVDNGKLMGRPSPDMASNVRTSGNQLDNAEATCQAPALNVGTPVRGDIKVRDVP